MRRALRLSAAEKHSRRKFIRGTLVGGAGLSAAVLIGCGDSDEDSPPADSTAGSSSSTSSGGSTSSGSSSSSSGGGTESTATPEEKELGFTFQSDGTPKPGGALTIAIASDMGSFDPTKSGATGNLSHIGTVYDTLLEWRRTTDEAALDSRELDKDVVGRLAESRETPDGQTYTFNLRQGVKWQNISPLDGRDFVAEDVIYALNRFATEGVWQTTFKDVVRMEAPDDHTVVIELNAPDPDFIVPLAEQNLSIHPREIVEDGSIDNKLIGTGPYVADEIEPGQGVKYSRNDDFWGKNSNIDNFELRIIPDAAARLAAFRTGQLDWHTVGSLADLEAVQSSNPGINAYSARYQKAIFHMAFNMDIPKYADIRLRRAVAMGLDHDEISDILYEGNSPVFSVIPYNHIFDDREAADLGPYLRNHNPVEATKLLQAAGAEDITIPQTIYRAYVRDQNDLWVDQLRRIGVNLELKEADYVEFNSQLAGISWTDTIGAWDQHGTQANNYFRNQLLSGAPANWSRINDAEIDVWSEQQAVELDYESRRDIQRKIWDKVLDQVYRVEYNNNISYNVVQPRVHGVSWSVGNDGLAGSWTGYSKNTFLTDIWMED